MTPTQQFILEALKHIGGTVVVVAPIALRFLKYLRRIDETAASTNRKAARTETLMRNGTPMPFPPEQPTGPHQVPPK